jgi:hypothetical protein
VREADGDLGAVRRRVYPGVQTYRYVQWGRVEDFMLMGWLIGKPASEHSCFAFACVCNPTGKEPRRWTKNTKSAGF